MIYAFMLALSCNTATKRDTIYTKLETFIANKPRWGETELSKGTGEDGKPALSLLVRFNEKPNLDNLKELAKTELNKLTGVTATFSGHICYHDRPDLNKSCDNFDEVTIVR